MNRSVQRTTKKCSPWLCPTHCNRGIVRFHRRTVRLLDRPCPNRFQQSRIRLRRNSGMLCCKLGNHHPCTCNLVRRRVRYSLVPFSFGGAQHPPALNVSHALAIPISPMIRLPTFVCFQSSKRSATLRVNPSSANCLYCLAIHWVARINAGTPSIVGLACS